MEQDSPAPSVGAITDSKAASPAARRIDVDVRSRDAFELLKLGEAIVAIKTDMRSLRLEKEDLRFERDRYKTAATDYQRKLVGALDDLDRARSIGEGAEQVRRDVLVLAAEFKERLAREQSVAIDQNAQIKYLHDQNIAQATVYEDRLRETVASLNAEHEAALHDGIVALAREFKAKLESEKSINKKGRRWHF